MTVTDGVVSKIEALERERDELVTDNKSKKEEITNLKNEIKELRNDSDAAEEIAVRAAELESEVVWLQHDAVAEMAAAEKARSETVTLRQSLEERETTVEFLEREVRNLKQLNAQSEMKVRDLERKLGVYEVRESEERSKRVRVEEEMREKVEEREREIETLRGIIGELEDVVMRKRRELEKWVKGKLELDEKVRMMEKRVVGLREEAQEAESAIGNVKREVNGSNDREGMNGDEFPWPIVAAGSGTIAAVAALLYFCFGKRRKTGLKRMAKHGKGRMQALCSSPR